MGRPRVVSYGLGPIGLGVAEILLQRGYEFAGAVDTDPAKAGRPLRELLPGAPSGVVIAPSIGDLRGHGADVVVHSTQSRLHHVLPQLHPLLEAEWNVISTCEELSYPWYGYPDDARDLDRSARAHGVRLLGTGVNPGFVMDLLPVVLTMPCREVRRITVTRVVDARQRRLPLQRKVGAGLSPDEFAAGVAAGRIAHVGLPESVAMLAAAVGWAVDSITETIDPVLDAEGVVRGLHQICRGIMRGQTASIMLDLTMAVGADDPRDEIRIDGVPPIHATIHGGVQGDQATCAIVANTLPRLLAAPPGLVTAIELPAALIPPRGVLSV